MGDLQMSVSRKENEGESEPSSGAHFWGRLCFNQGSTAAARPGTGGDQSEPAGRHADAPLYRK